MLPDGHIFDSITLSSEPREWNNSHYHSVLPKYPGPILCQCQCHIINKGRTEYYCFRENNYFVCVKAVFLVVLMENPCYKTHVLSLLCTTAQTHRGFYSWTAVNTEYTEWSVHVKVVLLTTRLLKRTSSGWCTTSRERPTSSPSLPVCWSWSSNLRQSSSKAKKRLVQMVRNEKLN